MIDYELFESIVIGFILDSFNEGTRRLCGLNEASVKSDLVARENKYGEWDCVYDHIDSIDCLWEQGLTPIEAYEALIDDYAPLVYGQAAAM